MTAGRILKWLFCFKRPAILQLSYIPVLIKDKPVLFVAWQVQHAWLVKFKPLKHKYYKAQNAVMLAIPYHLEVVTLKATNCWRTTTIHLPVQAIQLSEAATRQLIDGFRPLNKMDIHTPQVSQINSQVIPRPCSPKQRKSSIQKIDRFKVNVEPFAISIQPFNYQ